MGMGLESEEIRARRLKVKGAKCEETWSEQAESTEARSEEAEIRPAAVNENHPGGLDVMPSKS